ncbi:MAG: NAD(P)H-dependent oxidoreductase [Pseudomonadota bacterium]
MNIVAFAASNSRNSINGKLIRYVTGLLNDHAVDILDLNDFEMPLYSIDRENADGVPDLANLFLEKIGNSDALIISYAEHNGTYTAAFKNIFDWCSRINPKVFQNKPVVIFSTSPGRRGGASVLSQAKNSAHHFSADVLADLSVPSFYDCYDEDQQSFTDPDVIENIKQALGSIL